MKKRILIVTMMSFVLLSACGTDSANEQTDVGVDAKIDSYDSVDEMEEDADCIVIGKKVDVSDNICNRDSDGNFIGGYSLSDFVISEINKDDTGNLSEGDTITVLENEVYDETTGITYHIADYTAMNTEDEYILYLSFNTFDNGQEYYTPLAAIYGTVCLGDNYQMTSYTREYSDESYVYTDVDNLKEQIREEILKYTVLLIDTEEALSAEEVIYGATDYEVPENMADIGEISVQECLSINGVLLALYPEFNNPAEALQNASENCADIIEVLHDYYQLEKLSDDNWQEYQSYMWQYLEEGDKVEWYTEDSAMFAALDSFFDIYENAEQNTVLIETANSVSNVDSLLNDTEFVYLLPSTVDEDYVEALRETIE